MRQTVRGQNIITMKYQTSFLVFLLCSWAGFNISAAPKPLFALHLPHKYTKNIGKQNEKYRVRKVVIDAGHGGRDGGCHSKKSNEKDIALSIAKQLGALIEANFSDVKVIFTRKKDVFVELFRRAEIANQAKADLFISIHCNSMPAGEHATHGTETYVMGTHVLESNLAVEKRENASILLESDYEKNYDGYDPNSPVGHIMITAMQDGYLKQSMEFARLVENKFSEVGNRRSKGVKTAGFLVIRETAMPSVLIETGYLSNSAEADFLGLESGQQTIAISIFEAFKTYKQQAERDKICENTITVMGMTMTAKSGEQSAEELSKPKKSNKTPPQKEEYRVQLASSPIEINLRKGRWAQISASVEVKSENDVLKYVTTPFETMTAATAEQYRLRQLGFKDAFVVTYSGGTRKK